MEYRQLGNSELQIPEITFGAWAIGGWMWGGADRKDALEAIYTAINIDNRHNNAQYHLELQYLTTTEQRTLLHQAVVRDRVLHLWRLIHHMEDQTLLQQLTTVHECDDVKTSAVVG